MSGILIRPGKNGRGRGAVSLALVLASTLAACGARDERAARHVAAYEAALAADDPWGAKIAMQRAVAIKDDDPVYWTALGRVQLSLADYAGAFQSLARANELDRSNAAVLQSLADLSVMSGHVEEGRRYAGQVLLLAPDDPAPQATLGFVALRDRDYDAALARADAVLAQRPDDSAATILKGRALASTGRPDRAVALLEAFVERRPRDQPALEALSTIAGRFGNPRGQKAAQERLLALRPGDAGLQVDYAGTLYALDERWRAHALTSRMAESGRHGGRLIDILALWMRHEPRDAAVVQVRELAAGARVADRLRYAYFLMLTGHAGEGERLVAPLVSLPVTPANASPLALLAQTQAWQGRHAEALKLLDAVLAFDDSNVVALRARADLLLATGRGRDAVFDAQRLVAEKPRAADDRVRLARAYQQAGQPQLAENTYRAGIDDIPGNALLFAKLKAYLDKAGREDEAAGLDQRYVEQRRAAVTRW